MKIRSASSSPFDSGNTMLISWFLAFPWYIRAMVNSGHFNRTFLNSSNARLRYLSLFFHRQSILYAIIYLSTMFLQEQNIHFVKVANLRLMFKIFAPIIIQISWWYVFLQFLIWVPLLSTINQTDSLIFPSDDLFQWIDINNEILFKMDTLPDFFKPVLINLIGFIECAKGNGM